MIVDTINQQIATALKGHHAIRLSTLRLLSSALSYERIAKQHDLSEEEEQEVVSREAKKRKEAVEMYKNAGEEERADKEQQELIILQEFLPKQLTDEELIAIVDETVAGMGVSSMSDMGRAIGAIKQKVGSQADGSRIAELVKAKLQ